MSASMRANSAPSSSRPELDARVPAESRKRQPPIVNNHILPDELLVSLTSTVSSRSTLGHTAHHRHCKFLKGFCIQGCGIRRPDAVWHHQLGRKKYKFFLEQPTSLTGAGRDISFLCDAMVTQRKTTPLPPLTDRSGIGDTQNLNVSESLIPEEYHIVKNKGLRSLDAFTVQLQDDEQKLRVFPSLRPSGRLEVIQLMRMMDDMLEKAGVDQQMEELTELSQMEGLLELVHVEQSIYNIVFHELIRQVSVGCAERGQLLAKLRQRYQSLLERIPSQLKALHTETVAQRALDRRLMEEIHRIKTSIQRLNTELSRMRDHDASVSQLAERAHRQLAGALEQTHTNSDVVQRYHELYELQRGRLEAQLVQMTEERDSWSQLTFCLALKVCEPRRSFFSFNWTHISCFMRIFLFSSRHFSNYQVDVLKFGSYNMSSQQLSLIFLSPPPCSVSLQTLALQCDSYQGETLLCCQQTLGELGHDQERWLNISLGLFRRHASPDGEPRGGQQALRELDKVLSELLKQLDTQVSGESGIHGQIMSLLGLMESEVSKLGAVIDRPEMLSVSDWLKLEKALRTWKSLAEKVFENVSSMQAENKKDENKPDIFTETEEALDKVQEFITSMSNFTDGENQRLSEEVSSLHMGQTRWMLDLLLVMVPEHSEDHDQQQEHCYVTNISPQTLDKDAKMLTEKLNLFSIYITSSCKRILEEQILQNPHEAESEDEMNECRKLQVNVVVVVVQQGELTVFETTVVKLISYDGNITQRKLGESRVHLNGTEELVVSPATDEDQKAFSDLTTIGLLQQELHDSELRVQSTEQRSLKAEDALQSALETIRDLERQLQGRPSLKPKKRKKTPPLSPLPVTTPPKKTAAEAKPTSSTKKTKKR
uniref:Axonemal dynein light chain domain containing 1 n=1 Tax=Cyclopterus lumpus TaxID=8103 RepID=A0A8C3ATR4_CYCLU